MKYTKVKNVKDPQRANPGDAGIDFFMPPITDKLVMELRDKNQLSRYKILWDKTQYDHGQGNFERVIVLPAHERILIPSGIHVNLEPGTCMQAANKSGIATKLGLDRLAELVDESYQGEVHISLVNTSNDVVLLYGGMKIIQFVIYKYENCQPDLIPDMEYLYPEESQRGEGGFGSSGI